MPLLGFAGPVALVAPVGVIARILSLYMFRTVLYDRDGSVSYGAGMGFAPYFRESTSSSPVQHHMVLCDQLLNILASICDLLFLCREM